MPYDPSQPSRCHFQQDGDIEVPDGAVINIQTGGKLTVNDVDVTSILTGSGGSGTSLWGGRKANLAALQAISVASLLDGTAWSVSGETYVYNLSAVAPAIPATDRAIRLGSTFTVATSLVTKTAHGFVAGKEVYFTNVTGTAGGVAVLTRYYVINETANTFQLSLTSGGTAVAFSGSNWTADVYQAGGWFTENEVAVWVASTPYYAGDLAKTPGGAVVRKIATGSSTAAFDGTEAALWTLFLPSPELAYAPSVYYYAGDRVTQGTRQLIRAVAGMSAASFSNAEAGNWDSAGGTTSTWAAATYYFAGERVLRLGRLLERVSDGVSPATFDATEGANYTRLASETIAAYSNNFYYYFREQATHRGLTLTRTTAGLTSTAMDVTEATRWFATDDQTPMPFAGLTYYFDDQLMDHAGVIYRRNSATAGLSAATFTLVEAGNWTRVTSAADVAAWPANTYVAAGEVRTTTYGGVTVYIRCTTSHLTAATFTAVEAANWVYVSQASMAAFTASEVIVAGTRILHLGRLLERTATGTTTATFDATEGPAWTLIEAPPARDWVASKYYYATEPALSATGLVIARAAGGVSGATFDNTEAALWTSQIASTPAWAATTYVYLNQFLIHLGRVIQRTTASGISGATFDATEGAKYQFIAQQDVGIFAVGRYYFVGEQSLYFGLTMTRNTAGVSTAMDSTEAAKWTATTFQAPQAWVPSTYYFLAQQAFNGARIISKIAAGSSTATFNAAEDLLWAPVLGTTIDNVLSLTAAATLTKQHGIVQCDATGAAYAVTLPPVATSGGYRVAITKTDVSANVVTVTPPSGTISGFATIALTTQFQNWTVYCDGSSYYIT